MSPPPPSPHQKPTLSTLPYELRLQIWSSFFPISISLSTLPPFSSGYTALWATTYGQHHHTFKSLGKTCRVLHEDSLALWYAHRTLTFKSIADMYTQLTAIGPVARKYVGRVRLHLVDLSAQWLTVPVVASVEGGGARGRRRAAFALLAESNELRVLWISVDGDALKVQDGDREVWHASLLNAWKGSGIEMVRGAKGKTEKIDFRVRFAQISDGFEEDKGTVYRCGWLQTRDSGRILGSVGEFERVIGGALRGD